MTLRRRPTVGDVVRIGRDVVIRTVRRRRGRRTEIVQLIEAPGEKIKISRTKRVEGPLVSDLQFGP